MFLRSGSVCFQASRIRIRILQSEVRIQVSGSGSVPKCHRSPTLLPGSGSTDLISYRDRRKGKGRTHHQRRICRSGRGRRGSPSSPTVGGCPHALHKAKGLHNIRNINIRKDTYKLFQSQFFALFHLFKTTCYTYNKWQNIIYCISFKGKTSELRKQPSPYARHDYIPYIKKQILILIKHLLKNHYSP